MRSFAILVWVLLGLTPASAQQFRAENLIGQWYAHYESQTGATDVTVVIQPSGEWSSNSELHVIDALGLPVTYRSGQGGTLEFFPPATIRFAVFWQVPNEINGRGIDLPPGSTFTVEHYTGTRLVLLDAACAESAPREQCLLRYDRQQ